MTFEAMQFSRNGVVRCTGEIGEIFPLLCPKREEEWIPGWECETIWSKSGYNEEGAIFRTTKPYGTELFWTTLQFDITRGLVDFLITAPRLFMLRFKIEVHAQGRGEFALRFTQTFTAVSEEGNEFIKRYQQDDFAGRLKQLEAFLARHLERAREPSSGERI